MEVAFIWISELQRAVPSEERCCYVYKARARFRRMAYISIYPWRLGGGKIHVGIVRLAIKSRLSARGERLKEIQRKGRCFQNSFFFSHTHSLSRSDSQSFSRRRLDFCTTTNNTPHHQSSRQEPPSLDNTRVGTLFETRVTIPFSSSHTMPRPHRADSCPASPPRDAVVWTMILPQLPRPTEINLPLHATQGDCPTPVLSHAPPPLIIY